MTSRLGYILIIISSFLLIICCTDERKEKSNTVLVEKTDSIKVDGLITVLFNKRNDKLYYLEIKEPLRGKKIGLSENGNVNYLLDFYKGKVIKFQEFTNNSTNCLQRESIYLYNEKSDDIIAVSTKMYDSCKHINSSSIYTEVVSKSDTFNYNEKVKIKIKDHRGIEKKDYMGDKNKSVRTRDYKFIYGGFDSYFNIVDKDGMNASEVNNGEVFVELNTSTPGKNSFVGAFIEKVVYQDGSYQLNPNYINYNYYIQKDELITQKSISYYNFFDKFFK